MIKPCIKCGESKPRGEFYAHPRMADGTLNKCKSCCRVDTKMNHSRRLSVVTVRYGEQPGVTKTCRACGETKPKEGEPRRE